MLWQQVSVTGRAGGKKAIILVYNLNDIANNNIHLWNWQNSSGGWDTIWVCGTDEVENRNWGVATGCMYFTLCAKWLCKDQKFSPHAPPESNNNKIYYNHWITWMREISAAKRNHSVTLWRTFIAQSKWSLKIYFVGVTVSIVAKSVQHFL